VRRIIVTVLVLGACLLGAISGASAAGGQRVDERLVGTSEWSGQFLAETFSIQGTLAKGSGGSYSGTLHASPWSGPTPTCGPVCAPVTGTIEFVTRGGTFTASVDPGSFAVEIDSASHSDYEFVLDLTIVSGTGSYSHASGDLHLDYSSFKFNPPACPCDVQDNGTLTGTIVRKPS
jgi:hypothetical protein